MSIAVFFIGEHGAEVKLFDDVSLLECLSSAEALRKAGMHHVCISTEFSSNIGKAGVSSVEDGKTPDGVEYLWVKRR